MQKVKEPNEACDNGNFFDGTYRKSAKESYVNGSGNILNPPDLAALITRLKTIDISQFQIDSNTPRVAPENKSITLSSVYLYALKRESDEDYHIIIGTTQDPSTADGSILNVQDYHQGPALTSVRLMLRGIK